MSKMNLPNKLTVLRMLLVPVILLVGFLTPKNDGSLYFLISSAVCAVIFIAASVTDMLDGKIARRDNLVTNFGKFLDPIADKFMVIGTLFVILYKFDGLYFLTLVTLIVVVFRELAVTAVRMVVASENVVVPANMLGKIKTVTQIVAISTTFLEPVVQYITKLIGEAVTGNTLLWRTDIIPLTWTSIVISLVMTVWSGLNYIKAYWKYLDPTK